MRLFAVRVSVALAVVCLASCGPSASVDMDGGGNNNNGDGDGGNGCQGAQCQNKCPAGQMTSVSGVVRMPNGIDPVPQAIVYVPREVTEFPGEVRCEVCDQITDIAIVSTQTGDDGTFTLGPIPTSESNREPYRDQLVITIGHTGDSLSDSEQRLGSSKMSFSSANPSCTPICRRKSSSPS